MMSGKKRIELRSIGRPGAPVPTFFLIVAAVFVTCVIVTGGARAQSAPPAATSTGPKKAEEQFKNIQALKGIPADQLIPAMQFISASLGVECEFCHVHEKMDSDDKKPKKIARQMISMMLGIDKNNFDGRLEVTCYSC